MGFWNRLVDGLKSGSGIQTQEFLPRADTRHLETQVDEINGNDRALRAATRTEKLRLKTEADLLRIQEAEERKAEAARLLAEQNAPKHSTLLPGQFANFMRGDPTPELVEEYLKRHSG